MALVTWQDLCVDALDVTAMSTFWANVSGLDVADAEPPARLGGGTSRHTLWVNPVDRARGAKNRVHLDIYCASVDDLVDLGATVTAAAAETGLGWTRMADPEGNDFCAFVRPPDQLTAYRLHGIGIDCRDAEAQARWWGELFGADPTYESEHDCWTLTGVAVDARMTLDFNAVPEPRTEPNRVHWDVQGEVDALLGRGASHLWNQPRWTVLADPEGNEFCVFAPG
jgi:hypothetical protein